MGLGRRRLRRDMGLTVCKRGNGATVQKEVRAMRKEIEQSSRKLLSQYEGRSR